MDIDHPLALLAGLTPAQFMRRHWQKKPLLVRAAIPGFKPLLSRAELLKLATSEEVETRLIVKNNDSWQMKNGPFSARNLPARDRSGWTLLLQAMDGHSSSVHQLLGQFRFVPDARLDDVMISLASTGGGVGPHFDSYDVFLLQASGRRRWQIGRQKDLTLQTGVPLKILQNFEPGEEFVLDAGDMLYLPPRYAHDGTAVAMVDAAGKAVDCMTYSIGFKAPVQSELAAEMLNKFAEFAQDAEHAPRLYRDPQQAATPNPAELPDSLIDFAKSAMARAMADPLGVACALGEIMTAPKASVWFDEPLEPWCLAEDFGVRLDAKTRMMYDANRVFINGESYRAKGADATLMRTLANTRGLTRSALAKASSGAAELLSDWHAAGWIHLVQESVQ